MTDLENTKLCAEALELPQPIEERSGAIWCGGHSTRGFSGQGEYRSGGLRFNPLHNDAQAMALEDWLLQRGVITIQRTDFMFDPYEGTVFFFEADMTKAENHRRAIVECVAKTQTQKEEQP